MQENRRGRFSISRKGRKHKKAKVDAKEAADKTEGKKSGD